MTYGDEGDGGPDCGEDRLRGDDKGDVGAYSETAALTDWRMLMITC